MSVKLVSGASFSLALMLTIQLAMAKAPIAKPNCKDHCGNISIPYPFGMSKGCYLDEWFEIECNESGAFIRKISMELLNISIQGSANVKSPIISSNCSDRKTDQPFNLTGSPFSISAVNVFTAVGCNTRALMINESLQRLECESKCLGQKDVDWQEMLPNLMKDGSNPRKNFWMMDDYCNNGTDCCQIKIPSPLQAFDPKFQAIDDNQSTDGCKLAFLAGTYETNSWREKDRNVQFPMVLDWKVNSTLWQDYIRMINYGRWKSAFPENLYCYYSSSSSFNELIIRCSCNLGYEGNPYLQCTDIDECKSKSIIARE
ncbi:hypothetical protein GH714_026914 [Hevea brasiliensis]|uniref:Uncharacterized protein n=1 Tax=Hevea brasiliensis TaxID=3981 RepID=A0A6A6LJI0_HEVBR|nr:hypothetical protein GH714_026914 [Hevea brasiliensis]